jgi:hypothetical protein
MYLDLQSANAYTSIKNKITRESKHNPESLPKMEHRTNIRSRM